MRNTDTGTANFSEFYLTSEKTDNKPSNISYISTIFESSPEKSLLYDLNHSGRR